MIGSSGRVLDFTVAQEEVSYGDNFIANKMEPDDFGGLAFFEATTNRITHHFVELCDGVCFGKNRVAQRSGGVPAFRCFFQLHQITETDISGCHPLFLRLQ